MSDSPHDNDAIPDAEIVGQPAAPAALDPVPCRACPTGKAIPPAIMCPDCAEKRRRVQAALAKPVAPVAPVAKTGGKLATLPKPDGTSATAKPRPAVPLTTTGGAPHLCCQCDRQYANHPDPDDNLVRCGPCVRKNKADLLAFRHRH